ncbi:TetR/AcrR family transcriptional regulator [Pseudomonas shirazensis]|uniref:TetR/AcrR family transcriptional regulator n=1 Tax=Pseudomonas shirazensis TaxID=2745494 RepID=UPI0039881332
MNVFSNLHTGRQSRLLSNQDRVVELLATKGFSAVGLREMAASLDVTAAAFYHHFTSKDEYLGFLIESHYSEFLQVISARKRPRLCVRAVIEALIDLQSRRQWYFKLAAREVHKLGGDCEVASLRQRINERLLHALPAKAGKAVPETMLLTLLEHLLVWTCDASMQEADRKRIISRLLLAGALPAGE